MSKKSIVLAAASIMTAATVAIGGTLAYFSQQKELKNTFSMGGSSGGDSSFSILLDEAVVTATPDDNGTPVWTSETARTGKGNDYGDLVYPGAKLPKDPMVTNTGEYPMYTRMIVTLPNADVWMTALDAKNATELAGKVFTDTDPGFDTVAELQENNLVVTYTWRNVVTATGDTNKTGKAFTNVKIPAAFTGTESIFKNGANVDIVVRAEAIQSQIEGVDTAEKAFAYYVAPTPNA